MRRQLGDAGTQTTQTAADREQEASRWARAGAEKPEQPLRLSCSRRPFSDKDLADNTGT